jgi:DNA invertase Pin-like site-specific DNA recombinase
MLHSLAAQVSYYSDYIQRHPGWIYAGVYTDEAITGTRNNRPAFKRLINDCRFKKIDLVITKSISRFARNTVDLLETVRELKSLGVDMFFEEQNIHTMSGDGELMLTILASYAQEESRSASENCKWRIRDRFKSGLIYSSTILGYRIVEGTLQIVPEEAAIVRQIYADFLSGLGRNTIMKKLNAAGLKTRNGKEWTENSIDHILRNEKYAGDLLLQKTFNADHLSKRKIINQGELPMYYVENSHESIIDRDTFKRTKDEIQKRAMQSKQSGKEKSSYPFTSKIICGKCGKHFRRRIANVGSHYAKPVWICATFKSKGKAVCPSKQIPEDMLMTAAAEALGIVEFDEIVFTLKIKEIQVPEVDKLVFVYFNGDLVTKSWLNKSRVW